LLIRPHFAFIFMAVPGGFGRRIIQQIQSEWVALVKIVRRI